MSDYGTTKQEQQSVWKVLTRKSAASYMKEETVKVPVHYRKIGVEAFKSNIKMETLMLPNGMLEIGEDAFVCLLPIPGTAPGRAQQRHDRQQIVDRIPVLGWERDSHMPSSASETPRHTVFRKPDVLCGTSLY